MLLALIVSTLAVALGLALGLSPAARRRTLGPLRTLALAAVVAVVALHLLPEALSTLGIWGLALFALALALPRLSRLGRKHSHDAVGNVGLSLGFFGLLLHHLGDGLALGAYSEVGAAGGRPHIDVLLALVLHTVPLVAVVSAGYARTSGPSSAILRSAALALASAAGVVAARLVSPELAERSQGVIAAGVAALLLHGMTHDMDADLPTDRPGRVSDLLAAAAGVAIGWFGAHVEPHPELAAASEIPASFARVVERTALPLLVGLLLSLVVGAMLRQRSERIRDLRRRAVLAGLGFESLAIALVQFGWRFALAAHALALVGLAVKGSGSEPASADGAALGPTLDQRFDRLVAWALVAILLAAVVESSVPGAAFAAFGEPALLALAAALVLIVPVPALPALIVARALVSKGLAPSAALMLCAMAPAGRGVSRLRSALALLAIALLSLLVRPLLDFEPLPLDPRLSWTAAAIVLALALVRIYRQGLRSWLTPLLHGDARA